MSLPGLIDAGMFDPLKEFGNPYFSNSSSSPGNQTVYVYGLDPLAVVQVEYRGSVYNVTNNNGSASFYAYVPEGSAGGYISQTRPGYKPKTTYSTTYTEQLQYLNTLSWSLPYTLIAGETYYVGVSGKSPGTSLSTGWPNPNIRGEMSGSTIVLTVYGGGSNGDSATVFCTESGSGYANSPNTTYSDHEYRYAGQ